MKVLCHGPAVGLFGRLYLEPGENQVDEKLWSQLKNVQVPTKDGSTSYVQALIECGKLEVSADAAPLAPEPKPKKKRKSRKKKVEG